MAQLSNSHEYQNFDLVWILIPKKTNNSNRDRGGKKGGQKERREGGTEGETEGET
jgi:hypothetical protein